MTSDLKQLTSLFQAHDPASHVRVDPVVLSDALNDIVGDTTRAPQTAKRRWSRRQSLTLIPVTAVLVGAALVLPIVMRPGDVGPITLGPAKALAFAKNGDHIDVRIVDPDADPRRYREDFAAHGLNVDLQMVPSSPSLVGTMISISSPGRSTNYRPDGFEIKDEHGSEWIKKIEGTDCGNMWCMAGVSIPVGLHSPVEIIFGRAARPGERYEVAGDPTAHGEVLEGVDLANRPVAEVKRMLQQRNATVESYLEAPPEPIPHDFAGWDYTEHVLQPVSVLDTWYVHEAFGGHNKNSVRLVVASWPTDHPR
ncbi:hypothetical protein [Planotetraspora phitsanulokensis]|uniref:Uncharacterized protein n=1 Tax=Planotetraspora phitsanulokensis TaxID=575192 RepID=A0A8J3UB29_9ACTN|nr:hypothetical protein [Planotetraspora phitsanulokensis]GII42099.1 hypothetical protein Pph01_71020 [Planotetraspora phitsanulokensis]